jgi:hypothetical protein
MILKTLAVILFLIAAVLVFSGTRSDTFRIQRSIVIQVSPEKIFLLLNNLHN